MMSKRSSDLPVSNSFKNSFNISFVYIGLKAEVDLFLRIDSKRAEQKNKYQNDFFDFHSIIYYCYVSRVDKNTIFGFKHNSYLFQIISEHG